MFAGVRLGFILGLFMFKLIILCYFNSFGSISRREMHGELRFIWDFLG